MRPSTRLILCLVLIVGSALYGILVAKHTDIAKAVALGYIAVLLTVLTVLNLWKRT